MKMFQIIDTKGNQTWVNPEAVQYIEAKPNASDGSPRCLIWLRTVGFVVPLEASTLVGMLA